MSYRTRISLPVTRPKVLSLIFTGSKRFGSESGPCSKVVTRQPVSFSVRSGLRSTPFSLRRPTLLDVSVKYFPCPCHSPSLNPGKNIIKMVSQILEGKNVYKGGVKSRSHFVGGRGGLCEYVHAFLCALLEVPVLQTLSFFVLS